MDPFVDQLASLCRAHVTRAKWVFVPSHAVGRTLGERIALDGTNWLNLRFVTPLDIALRMGAPFLVERGIDPSEEGLGPALMMRLLLDLRSDGAASKSGYFRPLADQPTMAQALWTTMRELRMAGIKSTDVKREAFESEAKHAELRALLESYERYLIDNSRGDMASVYEEAMKHADWCPIQPEDCWTELPDTIWAPLQRRLIDAMPGERILPQSVHLPGSVAPRRLHDSPADRKGRLQPDPQATALAFLMSPIDGERDTPDPDPRTPSPGSRAARPIELFHAGGREAEVEEVFRRILNGGAALDQVEIACASDEHVALVWEKALRHEWPITLGSGIPAPSTRPGRALLGFCDWIETDFSAGHMRHLLQSGDMGIEEEDEGFKAGQAASTIARAEAGWGRATYGLSLGILQKSYESRAKDPDRSNDERDAAKKKAELTAKISRWITGLIAAVPEESQSGKVPLQTIVDVAIQFLERSTSRMSQLDYRSATALVEYVQELRALGPFECSLDEALRFIRERVQSLSVAPERPRPGHLYASRLQQSGHSGRPHLYVVGLEEGRVFPTASEDPVLLDSERAAISSALKTSSDRIDEAVYAVLARLGAHSVAQPFPGPSAVEGRAAFATFSYSCRDTREFRETYASWLMLQAFRLQQGDATLSYPQMKAALGEPVSFVPSMRETAATTSSWWLRSIAGTGDPGVEAVESSFPPLARGRHAQEQRESERFTEFDGHVPSAGAHLDPTAPGRSFSVTELEAAAGCPFRFFLKRGLGLRPLEEGERERDVWIDPMTRGTELHDLYAALLRRCRSDNRRPDIKTDGQWLRDLAQAALDRMNEEMPPATPEILERESKDFLADVELFLEAESEYSASEPIAFEVSFGRPLAENDEELAREEPVEIDLGGGLTFRIAGRIDRIDKVGASEFTVVDYKTGGFWRDDWKGTFAGGRRLQHALYGLAAVELLRARYENPKVTRAEYYFPSHKGRRERVKIAAPSRAEIASVLGDLRELIVQGAFVHAHDEKACKFCDYESVCGGGVHGQAEGKLADAKLKGFGRLVAHV
jgi:ATP-dependent helicase/nuclease subunit B